MLREPAVVLALPLSADDKLEPFVEACLRANVALIAVWGEGSYVVEDLIDEILVGDGSDSSRFITTSAHKDETLDEVVEFARKWVTEDGRSGAETVRL
ncbi:MAG: hypothetical protein DCF29_23035 [Alphaproteobacteria bacterium]|nr:MAG: hypothetical protein DCF29_23035 [Alphaproteobacteria bacterium]